MSFTLHEILQQIDPFVKLSDGYAVRPVIEWRSEIDSADPTEYVLGADDQGRLEIHQLDLVGCLIYPPVFVEQKQKAQRQPIPGFALYPALRDAPHYYA